MNARRTVVLLAALTVPLAAPLAGQARIVVVECPEQLALPARDGRNVMLTVAVEGAEGRAVWLALSPAEALDGGVLLEPAGAARFTINLAAADVRTMVGGSRRGELRVFAELADGTVIRSPALRFTSELLDDSMPTWVVTGAVGIASGQRGSRRTPWVDALDATEIAWYFAPNDRLEPVEARAGDRSWALVVEPTSRSARVTATSELREAWLDAGSLYLGPEGGAPVELRARPEKLRFEGIAAKITVRQRDVAELPGSRSYYELRIGDITGGQVLVEVVTDDRRVAIPRRSMRARDEVALRVGTQDYVLRVDSLVNRLIGDDHGVFSVEKLAWSELDRIATLLARLASSDLRFLRGSDECSGSEAAAHLRRKLDAEPTPIGTVEEFVHRIASRSSVTGEAYRVRFPDGRTRPAEEWLREQVRAIDAERPRDRAHERTSGAGRDG